MDSGGRCLLYWMECVVVILDMLWCLVVLLCDYVVLLDVVVYVCIVVCGEEMCSVFLLWFGIVINLYMLVYYVWFKLGWWGCVWVCVWSNVGIWVCDCWENFVCGVLFWVVGFCSICLKWWGGVCCEFLLWNW